MEKIAQRYFVTVKNSDGVIIANKVFVETFENEIRVGEDCKIEIATHYGLNPDSCSFAVYENPSGRFILSRNNFGESFA